MRPSLIDEPLTTDWKTHWGLDRFPFAQSDSPYVSLPSHDEAVARLAKAIENADRRAVLAADAGMGKSTVLAPGAVRRPPPAPAPASC